jgi:hypothetical protein
MVKYGKQVVFFRVIYMYIERIKENSWAQLLWTNQKTGIRKV